VAHHGSITSSSEAFLDYVNPKEAYMMVSLKNKHGHPSDVVVNRFLLRNIDLHRTDQLGTIEIRYFLEKEWKKTSK
jgi:competence protein ComEC